MTKIVWVFSSSFASSLAFGSLGQADCASGCCSADDCHKCWSPCAESPLSCFRCYVGSRCPGTAGESSASPSSRPGLAALGLYAPAISALAPSGTEYRGLYFSATLSVAGSIP